MHFPEGEPGTHQFRNDTEEPVRVLLGSSKGRLYVAGYPDSGKLNVSWPGARRMVTTPPSSTTGTASSSEPKERLQPRLKPGCCVSESAKAGG